MSVLPIDLFNQCRFVYRLCCAGHSDLQLSTDTMRPFTPFLVALVTFVAYAGSGHAQTLYEESFDNDCVASTPRPAPAPLTTHNVDGRIPDAQVAYVNNAWIVREDFKFNVSNCAAFSTSYYNPVGAANDWLVLPPITAAANTQLSWKAVTYDPAYPDGYEVRVSTGGGAPADFTSLLHTVPQEASTWTTRQLSLGAFAGQTVRVAFRNVSNDKFLLLLDDLLIQNVGPGVCGTSHGGLFSAPPAANLCSAGTASAVTAGPSTYTWACNGTGGGGNASCSANLGHDLTSSAVPPSGGTVNCTANIVVDGGASTCTATANAGFIFSGWSGDCNGATCNLAAVTSPKAVTANFSAQAQAVSIPTLSQWGLIFMSCLVAMLGITCVQRRS